MRAQWTQDTTLRDWLALNREIIWDTNSNSFVLAGSSEGGTATRAPSERSTSVSLSPVATRRTSTSRSGFEQPVLRVTVPVTPLGAERFGDVDEEEEEEEDDDENEEDGEETGEEGEEDAENEGDTAHVDADADAEGEPDYTTFPAFS
jgi:hypothetical protein